MDCLFCDIASKKIPALVLYEDEKTMAFLDIHPLAPGHTVVIPKSHAENILKLDENSVAQLFSTVRKMVGVLKESLGPEGFTIGINHGRTAGIDHLHIHIMPRWLDDKGGSIHSVVNNPPKESLESIREKVLKLI